MFGSVVLDIPKHAFEEVFDGKKEAEEGQARYRARCQGAAGSHRRIQKGCRQAHQALQYLHQQLVMARDAVFRSWLNDRAKT